MKHKSLIFPLLLLVYHLSFSWVAYQFVLENKGDAMRYWFLGDDLSKTSWSSFLKPGTDVVKFFTFPLVKYLNFPFWSGFFIFSLLSFTGFWMLYKIIENRISEFRGLKSVAIVLLFLPNLHFWTSIIGKEALIFIPLIIMISEIIQKKYFSFLLLFSVVIIAIIRPHVSFILVFSYVLSLLIAVKMTKNLKMKIIGSLFVATGIFTFLLTRLQDFSGGFQRVVQKYETHIQHFKKTNAYVPLDEYSLPFKIFTFYFRPFPFEKSNIFYQVIGIENFVLFILFSITIYFSIKNFQTLKKQMLFVFPLILMLLFSMMYVYAYANYGIIMRTKVMVMPMMYLLILEVMMVTYSKYTHQN